MAQTALWAVSTGVLLSSEVRETLRGLWARGRLVVVATVVAVGVPIVVLDLGATVFSPVSSNPIPGHKAKLLVLLLVGTAIALIGAAEIALVGVGLRQLPGDGSLAATTRYLELRALLDRVLVVLGVIIGAAVLTAGALRNTINAYRHSTSAYPKEYVLIVGITFTILLALLYGPVFLRALAVGRANLEAACPPAEPASEGWVDVNDKRQSLATYLQLDGSTSTSFRAALAILAPLSTALVSLLLGN
jgi:hypothetical protein